MELKQHKAGGDGPDKDQKTPKPDDKLAAMAKKGKDLLGKLDEAQKKKSGHWEQCCGVRVWVKD